MKLNRDIVIAIIAVIIVTLALTRIELFTVGRGAHRRRALRGRARKANNAIGGWAWKGNRGRRARKANNVIGSGWGNMGRANNAIGSRWGNMGRANNVIGSGWGG